MHTGGKRGYRRVLWDSVGYCGVLWDSGGYGGTVGTGAAAWY